MIIPQKQLNRYYYTIPQLNRFKVILAYSRIDALMQIAYSEDMPLLQHIRWLN